MEACLQQLLECAGNGSSSVTIAPVVQAVLGNSRIDANLVLSAVAAVCGLGAVLLKYPFWQRLAGAINNDKVQKLEQIASAVVVASKPVVADDLKK